jgi:hypothetical protein
MQLNIHNITKIKTERRQHSLGDRSFFVLSLDVETEDKGTMTLCLFSDEPIVLIGPAMTEVCS